MPFFFHIQTLHNNQFLVGSPTTMEKSNLLERYVSGNRSTDPPSPTLSPPVGWWGCFFSFFLVSRHQTCTYKALQIHENCPDKY
uniref:Uncharacterized protein n=1 Tax=Rhizophora mucronata TaxID=61149 RepID=A0A2P2Q4C5_RHIMU